MNGRKLLAGHWVPRTMKIDPQKGTTLWISRTPGTKAGSCTFPETKHPLSRPCCVKVQESGWLWVQTSNPRSKETWTKCLHTAEGTCFPSWNSVSNRTVLMCRIQTFADIWCPPKFTPTHLFSKNYWRMCSRANKRVDQERERCGMQQYYAVFMHLHTVSQTCVSVRSVSYQ